MAGMVFVKSNFDCPSVQLNVVNVQSSVVVIPFFSELELELYLLRKEPELELAELDQLLELAPGIQCLGQSN